MKSLRGPPGVLWEVVEDSPAPYPVVHTNRRNANAEG
jgi:hypothetical protein